MVMLYIVNFLYGIKVQALRGFFIYDFAFNLSLTITLSIGALPAFDTCVFIM